jgi:hypothetical protein
LPRSARPKRAAVAAKPFTIRSSIMAAP